MALFGTDGIRGVVNEELTPEIAFRLGNTLGKYIDKKIFVAADTRASADMFISAITAGATSAGANVYNCGVLPTPALALITKLEDATGVMVSASHNPAEFNGLKIISKGFKLPDEVEEQIEKRMKEHHYASYDEIGHLIDYKFAFEEYVDYVIEKYKDVDLNGIKILVDTTNGATINTTPHVLKELGAKVEVINNQPDGFNINKNCGSTDPKMAISKMTNHNIAILHDGDGDRVIMLDDKKREFHGDKMIGVTAEYMKEIGRLKNDVVVGTVLTNLGLEKFLKERNIKLERTKVGDRYVLERLLQLNGIVGGEQSGHVIYLDRSTTGDGLITALEVLNVITKKGVTLSELYEKVPDYPQVMINIMVKSKSIVEHPEIKETIKKFENEDLMIIVRPSGTEPLVRVFVQGENEEKVSNVAYEISEKIKAVAEKE